MEEPDFSNELPCKADFILLLVMKLLIWQLKLVKWLFSEQGSTRTNVVIKKIYHSN